MKFQESKLAHAFLDGLQGLEIGGGIHNPFGLNTKNVDYTEEVNTFKQYELDLEGEMLPIDILAPGDDIPLPDESQDFILSSHSIEHFPDPIKALKEWYRLIKPGGYIFIIAPHKERTFDKDRPRTTLKELIGRHEKKIEPVAENEHFSVWITEDFVELVEYLGWEIVFVEDIDDKVGNGFTIVIQKGRSGISRDFRERYYRETGVLIKNSLETGEALEHVFRLYMECFEHKGILEKRDKDLQEEVSLMKNSKFWKLRDFYMRVKNLV